MASLARIVLYMILMRSLLLIICLSSLGISIAAAEINGNCTLKGIALYGKVQVVNSFADFKVQRVAHFPDLKVQWVRNFPSDCGKWQEVSSFPDFTIQWVDSFPDFTIQEVSSFPGVN